MKPEVYRRNADQSFAIEVESVASSSVDCHYLDLKGFGKTELQARGNLLVKADRLRRDLNDLIKELESGMPSNLLVSMAAGEMDVINIQKQGTGIKPHLSVDEDGNAKLEFLAVTPVHDISFNLVIGDPNENRNS